MAAPVIQFRDELVGAWLAARAGDDRSVGLFAKDVVGAWIEAVAVGLRELRRLGLTREESEVLMCALQSVDLLGIRWQTAWPDIDDMQRHEQRFADPERAGAIVEQLRDRSLAAIALCDLAQRYWRVDETDRDEVLADITTERTIP